MQISSSLERSAQPPQRTRKARLPAEDDRADVTHDPYRPVQKKFSHIGKFSSSHVSKNARPFDKLRAGCGAPGTRQLSPLIRKERE
jgi:hypothetical protein